MKYSELNAEAKYHIRYVYGRCQIHNGPTITYCHLGKCEGPIADLVIDHSHSTDDVRGVLCHFCNYHFLPVVEGIYRGSQIQLAPFYVEAAQKYLDNPPLRNVSMEVVNELFDFDEEYSTLSETAQVVKERLADKTTKLVQVDRNLRAEYGKYKKQLRQDHPRKSPLKYESWYMHSFLRCILTPASWQILSQAPT